MVAVAPRSIVIQPGSTQPLVALVAQRVAGSKSVTRAGTQPGHAPSSWNVDAVAGLLYDSRPSGPGSGSGSGSPPPSGTPNTWNSHSE
jgi:hypothetical protein